MTDPQKTNQQPSEISPPDSSTEPASNRLHIPSAPLEPQSTAASAETAPRDAFAPFDKKTARKISVYRAGLYLVLAALGIMILTLGGQAVAGNIPYWLEVVTVVLATVALMGVLWKTISLEAKVGLAACGLGLILIIVEVVHGGSQLSLIGIPVGWYWPIWFAICLLSVTGGIWMAWSRPVWPPLVGTAVTLYTALAVVWPLIKGGADLKGLVLGPDFQALWPIYIRSGWLMIQVLLPLGILLFLGLQIRTLFRPQYERHFGHFFWALFLLMLTTVGMTSLERAGAPAWVEVDRLVSGIKPKAVPTVTAPSSAGKVEKTEPGAAAKSPKETASTTTPAISQKTEKTEGQADSLTAEKPTTSPQASVSKPGGASSAGTEPQTAANQALPGNLDLLMRIEGLKEQVRGLEDRLDSQEKLIETLMEYLDSEKERSYNRRNPGRNTPPDDEPDSGDMDEYIPKAHDQELT
ncbi:MAG: hypothetical protein HQK55_03455 [Deltaproteobacteria bacterium]|nr:hypothetical protein [Deltaproteobacteria bacterium]